MFTQWDAWRIDQELVKGCKIYFPQCSPSVPLNKEGFFAVIIYMASTYSSVKLSHLKDHPLFNKLPLLTNKGVEDSFKPGFWETQKTGKYTTFYLFSKSQQVL